MEKWTVTLMGGVTETVEADEYEWVHRDLNMNTASETVVFKRYTLVKVHGKTHTNTELVAEFNAPFVVSVVKL